METTFEPRNIEQGCYETWEKNGYFAPSGRGDPYCIMIPPPNVTGTLHMGHAFQDTLMDALVRYQRMRGRDTLWQTGMDHAGIATQMVVERQLNLEGKTRQALGRDAFVDRVWKWKAESGGTIAEQLRRLGASTDWSRERFTMDPDLSQAVTEVFVRLHQDGLIYRGKRLVNWDPVLHTALSDLEVMSEEESGHLWHLRYPLVDAEGYVVVATTRPETLLGDTAVAVHPDDERYRHLVGTEVELPLTGRRIPVIADEHVDPEFGSGCVKITPAHDFNDYEIGQRHGLAMINVLNPDATLNGNAPQPYQGLPRFEARERVVADMQTLGLVERIVEHRYTVPRGDRSGEVLEPYLTDQWYVKVGPLAEMAIQVVQEGRIRFVPENWAKTYFEWMHKIQDWCISRQLWWGHRIPAWYDDEGEVYVGRSEREVREQHHIGPDRRLRQDDDVLDTWFSSALWPFSTLGWPEATPELQRYYPTSVLITGFDIIFFWVARMIMMGVKFAGDVPFREVYIHGLIIDADGQKMSKSKGNTLDPLDLVDGIELEELIRKRTSGLMQPQMQGRIERTTRQQFPQGIPAFGTDALRFTFAALATTAREIRFDLGRLEGYRNFCNKLWNASRYVWMNTRERGAASHGAVELGVYERWIRSRLHVTIDAVHQHLTTYRFDLAAQALYEFTWRELCDWYLELSKPVLQSDDVRPERKLGTERTLLEVLEGLLRLAHPFMPFITEAIWQRVAPLAGRAGDTIMLQPYPDTGDFPSDPDAEAEIAWLVELVLGVRQIRGEYDIAPSRPVSVLHGADLSAPERARVDKFAPAIRFLARVDRIEEARDHSACATFTVGPDQIQYFLPLDELVEDFDAEIARLEKKVAKQRQELARTERRLTSEDFRSKAPAAVVEEHERRRADLGAFVDKLERQIQLLQRAQQDA